MKFCQTCSYHKKTPRFPNGGGCTCPKLYEFGCPPEGEENGGDAHLVYSYYESGGFWTGNKFGCVHHKELMTEQEKIAFENMKFNLNGWYSEYKGNKSVGCVSFWIGLFTSLHHAENCCLQQDGSVTLTPYTNERIANRVEWIEDSPNNFRPRFEFSQDFYHAELAQEIFEKGVACGLA